MREKLSIAATTIFLLMVFTAVYFPLRAVLLPRTMRYEDSAIVAIFPALVAVQLACLGLLGLSKLIAAIHRRPATTTV